MSDDPKNERLELRVPPAWLKRLDDWRRKHPDMPTRGAAVRLIVDEFLAKKR